MTIAKHTHIKNISDILESVEFKKVLIAVFPSKIDAENAQNLFENFLKTI